jgi:hypothetical protein
MSMPYRKRLETVAAMVVEAETGLFLTQLDPGGGSRQLADFTMLGDHGAAVGVLEVTTQTVAARAQFAARARNQEWSFPELECAWAVHVSGIVQPREIRRQIGPPLRALEKAGRTGDWVPAEPGLAETDPGALPAELAILGVVRLCAFGPGPARPPTA